MTEKLNIGNYLHCLKRDFNYSRKLVTFHQRWQEEKILLMKKFNQFTFFVLIVTIFLILFYKAFTLPVVNDEVPTAVTYIQYSVWEIMMYPDHWPNNHILNTLFTKLFVGMFGNEQLVIRLPALLSFLLYGFGIYRINRLVLGTGSVFFLPAALLFVCNPYLLDFFGLCRGYGMSCAFAVLSVSYLIKAYMDSKDRAAWIAFVLSVLASYANFTLMVFWAATGFMVGIYFLSTRAGQPRQLIRPAVVLGILTLLYLALIANPMIKMHSTDEFQYWTSKGFYWDTIYPLIAYSHTGSVLIPGPHVIAAFVFAVIVINLGYVLIMTWRSGFSLLGLKQPAFVTTALLLCTVLINIIQCALFNTPNLHGRTALFFYPLFITVAVSFLGILPVSRFRPAQVVVACCLTFICIFHLADRFQLKWVRDYWHDVNTLEVLEYFESRHPGELVTLKTSWLFYHSFHYYEYTGKTPWLKLEDYDKTIDPDTRAEYYYVFTDDAKFLEPLFAPVQDFGNNRVLVRKRDGDQAVPSRIPVPQN
jgi:hypothetical protein